MTSRTPDNLSDEDRVLWSLVAKSTVPLKPRKRVPAVEPQKQISPAEVAASAVSPVQPLAPPPAKRPNALHALDRPTLEKLAKGRLPIEGRVDLHGMTQSEAHALLLSFLQRARSGGARYVLVITGKGSSSRGEGILRRAVPAWLTTPPFRSLVSSHEGAARNHGGGGAIYVRLRRLEASAR